MRCSGKAGVVTGSSRGLGREILLALAGEGASVVGVARDQDAGRQAAEEASAAGGQASFMQGDVRREEDIVAAVERCREEFGALDFIVNNAGILGEGRLHETSNEQWDDLVATHLTATFWGCKHAVEAMRESRRGGSATSRPIPR
jgi:NAD(P)-dependent dehydrogenase (short-subunit alcohol dehydrogenase family)